MNKTTFILSTLCLFIASFVHAQVVTEQERVQNIRKKLETLSLQNPGLNEQVDISVRGVSLQEFLASVAETNNLNINVDPFIDIRIYNNFNNETVLNILVFLVKEYNLDIEFTGSIMSVKKYVPPPLPEPEPVQKEIMVKYKAYNDQLSLDLDQDTLSQVVKKITAESGKNVIIPSKLSEMLVSGYIQQMPFESALEKIAFANNLTMVKTSDNFYVLREIADEEAAMIPGEMNKLQTYENPFPPFEKSKKAKNTSTGNLYVDVKRDTLGEVRVSVEAIDVPIKETIRSVAEAVGISYFLYSEIKGNTTTRVLNVLFDEFLQRLLQGTEITYKIEQGLYLVGDRTLEGLRTTTVLQLQYRSVEDVVGLIPAELKKNVEIKEFKDLNSILLSGSYPRIQEIRSFVAAVDKVVPMVLIEVIIMDVRNSRNVSTGITAGVSDTVSTGGTLLPGTNFTFSSRSINRFLQAIGLNNTINLGRVSPNFYLTLKALEENANVEVRSVPKLSTLNGHPATLAIGSKRYYVNETQNLVGSLNPQTVITRQFNEVEANLAINIQPIVSGDEQVTLTIDVDNSDFIEIRENAPPAKAVSHFNSMIRVRNEEMIVLGGLERYEKSNGGKGVPFLSRIPVLKYLFGSRTRNKSKTVTLVFIKPTIIY